MSKKGERLDKLMVKKGLVSSRTKAQALIMAGKVIVDGNRIEKAGSQLDPEVEVSVIEETSNWVSRGAHKLLKALDSFRLSPEGRVCLDIGASTGGFTHVLLEWGAKKVYSVDVGYGQLAWKIRQDPRVVVMERTNARYLKPQDLQELPELITIDASFISLRILLPAIAKLMDKEAVLVSLVKPQFEAGKNRVGKNGVVRDPEIHFQVIKDLCTFIWKEIPELSLEGIEHSPITGPKGNIEFLLHLRSAITGNRKMLDESTIENIVQKAHNELLPR